MLPPCFYSIFQPPPPIILPAPVTEDVGNGGKQHVNPCWSPFCNCFMVFKADVEPSPILGKHGEDWALPLSVLGPHALKSDDSILY